MAQGFKRGSCTHSDDAGGVMEMDLSNKTTHQIEYSARINENELYNLIADYVAKKSEIELLSSDRVHVYLSHEDKGSIGYGYVAHVSIKRDLGGDKE